MSLSNEQLLRQINLDRALGCQILFAHRHKQASPEFHVTVADLWRCADELVSIKVFRGGAKTTLGEETLLLEAAYHNFNYCLIFGETYTKACDRITAMKHEILNNLKMKTLFGNLKGAIWSENRILLTNGVLIEAHGWEEEIRGYKHLEFRPDRAHLDDIENKERTRDSNIVDTQWKKLHMELIPAMADEYKIRLTGTPLGDDCMINRAEASANWVSATFPICDREIDDPKATSLWPGRFPMQKIREMRDKFSCEGMLREFNQEFMMIATGSQGKPFTEEMLRYEDVAPQIYSPRTAIIDPARTVEVKKSDQTGHVVLSRVGTRIYVHESGGEYWQPDQVVDGAFKLSADHEEADVVIEKNSLDDWLLQPIRAKQLQTGQFINVRGINAPQDQDKAAFIMGLRPFFVAGDIILVGGRAKHQQLVSQLLNFPTGKRDILNALAYCLRVFSGVPIYGDFGQDNIVHNWTLNRTSQLILAANATAQETTALLVAVDGRCMTVLCDWVSPLVPADSIPDIARLIRAVYPGKSITAWAPAEQFEQVGRNPLLGALKAAKLEPHRGEHTGISRGSLSPYIRTSFNGRRMLQVERSAKHTLQALVSGYQWPVKSGGERASEPQRGPAKTLIEALETLTFALDQPDGGKLSDHANAHNTLGTPYISALPRKDR